MGTPEPTTPTLRALVAAGVLTPETSVAIELEAWRQSLKQVRARIDAATHWTVGPDLAEILAILDSLSPKEK